MKNAIILTLLLTFNVKLVKASELDILETYEATAQQLLVVLENSTNESVDVTSAQALLDQLVDQGVETMKLIGAHKPECVQQFNVFISEIPVMKTMSLNDIHKKYHDGVGLPTAPKYCYFGRSQIVHPVMSKVLLNSGWNAEIKEEVVDQANEVIEHNERIKTLIK